MPQRIWQYPASKFIPWLSRFPLSTCRSIVFNTSSPLATRPRRASMEILIPADRIQQRVGAMAREIAGDYQQQQLTIVGVLTGCLMFLADLVRHLDLPLRIGLLQASSYRGNATMPGKLHIRPELIPYVLGL